MNYLPHKLLKLRKHYNYSQSHVAKVLDIETLEYMAFENGNSIPDYKQMKMLASLYHVDLIEIFRNDDNITLYDTDKADTDEINIAYFMPEKTMFDKVKDFISEHKLASGIIVFLCVMICILLGILDKARPAPPEEPHEVVRENINRLSVSQTTVVYIDDEGTVSGTGDNSNGQINFHSTSALKVAEGEGFTIILDEDGTLSSAGLLSKYESEISSWKNIVDIAAGNGHIIAIDEDGKVYCAGDNEYGQCNLAGNKNIAKVFATAYGSIIMDENGIISCSGTFIGSSSIKRYSNIIDVDSSDNILAILNSDGTLNVYGNDNYLKAESWDNLVDVACGNDFVAALDEYGKVHIEIKNETITEEVSSWSNIIAIDAGNNYLIAYDGNTIYGIGQNNYHQYKTNENNKQTLPTVTNIEYVIEQGYIDIQFTPVNNASEYLVSINVGTGIEERVSKNESQARIPSDNMIDGKYYTISIIAVGSGDYADSGSATLKFQYLEPEIIIEEEEEVIEDEQEQSVED